MNKLQQSSKLAKTRRGVTSLYVVIFATILFGVITVSFTRLILSEATQSSNDDLSQSAYDSAIAGVEDAKVAINEYYDCVTEKGRNACSNKNVFSPNATDENCAEGFPLGRILYGTEGEVLIQESGQREKETFVDQAYTCVVISDITPDYRGTLTSDTRTRVVPLSVSGSTINIGAVGNVSKIKFSWYSELNQGSNTNLDYAEYNTNANGGAGAWVLKDASNKTVPPAMQITLIRTDSTITPSDFWNADNTGKVLYSAMTLLPTDDDDHVINPIPKSMVVGAGNVLSGYNAANHMPVGVKCETGQEFICNVDLEVADLAGGLLHNGDNVFLVVNMPYGDAFTDFKVELAKTNADGTESRVDFQGSQISVDSTGRTNQLYRRVEARLDAVDMFFPYPEFEISTTGGGGMNVTKSSWVTNNCWQSWYSTNDEYWHTGTCKNNSGSN